MLEMYKHMYLIVNVVISPQYCIPLSTDVRGGILGALEELNLRCFFFQECNCCSDSAEVRGQSRSSLTVEPNKGFHRSSSRRRLNYNDDGRFWGGESLYCSGDIPASHFELSLSARFFP